MSRVRQLEFPSNHTQRRVPDAETFSVFADLVFFAEELVAAGQPALGAPAAVVVFGCELALKIRQEQRKARGGGGRGWYPCFSVATV